MKKNTIIISFLAAVVVIASSCKKYLEITPKGYLIAGKTTDYDNLLNNANLAGGLDLLIPMGDDVVASDPYFSSSDFRTQRLFKWSETVYEANEDDALISSLGAGSELYPINKVISEVMNSEGGTEAQKTAIQSQARGVRAWIYFYFINFYGKPYNAATAATDPGYPIITTADVTQNKFNRESVQAVYDFIVDDLKAAVAYAPAAMYGTTRMSKSTAEMMLGKVYLFMGKYEEALSMLDSSFKHLPAATNFISLKLNDYKVQLADYGPWGYNSTTPMFWFFTSPTYNSEHLFTRTLVNRFAYIASDILVSPEVVDSYPASDLRRKFLGGEIGTNGPYKATGAQRRLGFQVSNLGLTLPDLYLMRAECRARLNNIDGAVTDLQTLRATRMSNSADVAVPAMSKEDLIKFVLAEKTREYAGMGLRWLDMRRLSTDPLFAGTVYTHRFYKSDGTMESYTLKPERFTLKFPQKLMDQNPGMINNP